jgi:hypothetical protein
MADKKCAVGYYCPGDGVTPNASGFGTSTTDGV